MAAPTVEGTVGPTLVTTGNLAFTVPSGASEGDLLIAHIADGTESQTWTLPNADWTEEEQLSGGAGTESSTVFWAYVTSAGNVDASSSQTFQPSTGNDGGLMVLHLSGTASSSPVHVKATGVVRDSLPSALSVTPTLADCLIVDIGGVDPTVDDTNVTQSESPAETATERWFYAHGSGYSNIHQGCWTYAQPGGAEQTTSTIDTTGSLPDWSHHLLAIAPGGATIEQEGFRWYDDDADAATGLELQDVDITRATETTTRLRVILNATGDPATNAYRLQYKKDTGGGTWLDVPSTP